jgi:hypothetical protein
MVLLMASLMRRSNACNASELQAVCAACCSLPGAALEHKSILHYTVMNMCHVLPCLALSRAQQLQMIATVVTSSTAACKLYSLPVAGQV